MKIGFLFSFLTQEITDWYFDVLRNENQDYFEYQSKETVWKALLQSENKAEQILLRVKNTIGAQKLAEILAEKFDLEETDYLSIFLSKYSDEIDMKKLRKFTKTQEGADFLLDLMEEF